MLYKQVFTLNKMESNLIVLSNKDILQTEYCKEGFIQEKGEQVEQLVLDLLSLCDVEVLRSEKSSALDEILKVDIVVKNNDEFKDIFAFQVKSSLTGAKVHYEKYGSPIKYKNKYFRTPWCLIVDGSQSNEQILDELINELCLNSAVDFEKVDSIAKTILQSNGKRLSITEFPKLNSKEIRALRLLHDISKNNKTFFWNIK